MRSWGGITLTYGILPVRQIYEYSPKIADHIGQEYKGGGITQTEVTPIGVSVTSYNGLTTSIIPSNVLDISDNQSAKKIVDYQTHNKSENW
jgi:hypothetical protein